MTKRILITGAAGFLGSHLCDRFIAEGYQEVGMDNLITGDVKNIEHLFPVRQFEFYNHDVSNYVHATEQDLEDILRAFKIDLRIVGDEYRYQLFTGRNYCDENGVEFYFNKRDHRFQVVD